MCKKNTSIAIRFIALLLIFFFISPVYAQAAEAEPMQPRASAYLDNYAAYVYLPGNGQVQVYFDVTGTNVMDELGALSIAIYESTDGVNWTWKDTFKHDLTYNGVVGRYYKAYVCIWGGKNGQGDTRYFWTSAKH